MKNPDPKSRVQALMEARYGSDQREPIERALQEIESLADFQYTYQLVRERPVFLQKDPYASFLKDCKDLYLIATTLGWRIEKRLNQLQLLDMKQAFLFDQAAGLYLEELANAFEKELGRKNDQELTWRFCPGYKKSSLQDNDCIFKILKPRGIELSDSYMIRPSKSMVGIVGIKKKNENK